jgi:hypothetical protein
VRSGVEVDIRPFQTRENNPPSRRVQGSRRVRTRLRGDGRGGSAHIFYALQIKNAASLMSENSQSAPLDSVRI